jgi:hypothetical protein
MQQDAPHKDKISNNALYFGPRHCGTVAGEANEYSGKSCNYR